MKKIIALFICLTFFQTTHTKNVVQMSIPKAGTYLLMKCIRSLTGVPRNQMTHVPVVNYPAFFEVGPDEFCKTSQQKKHFHTHLFFNKEFEQFLNNDKNAFFFIYRDPRDQLISLAYFMLRIPHWSKEASALSFDDLILALIQTGEIYKNSPPCDNIDDLYQHYMPWLSAPYVCSVRFEDLVGPKGGGNREAQLKTVKKIADHLDIVITDERIQEIAGDLFGGSATFRKGQIGAWKHYFKEHHKKAFKEIAGQLLVDLGYEKDFNW